MKTQSWIIRQPGEVDKSKSVAVSTNKKKKEEKTHWLSISTLLLA